MIMKLNMSPTEVGLRSVPGHATVGGMENFRSGTVGIPGDKSLIFRAESDAWKESMVSWDLRFYLSLIGVPSSVVRRSFDTIDQSAAVAQAANAKRIAIFILYVSSEK